MTLQRFQHINGLFIHQMVQNIVTVQPDVGKMKQKTRTKNNVTNKTLVLDGDQVIQSKIFNLLSKIWI